MPKECITKRVRTDRLWILLFELNLSVRDEETYFINDDQIFLYKRKNKWTAPKGYCFVKPLKAVDQFNIESESDFESDSDVMWSTLDWLCWATVNGPNT